MRLDTVSRDVQSSTVMKVARATVAPSLKIFNMFEDGTYANKPEAIMRELVANGIDAHVMAGCADRPVEVILPTSLDPMCVIRDFGTGMSPEFMIGDEDKGIPSKFMAYTDGSTKDSDDDQIGGFGIGSKSPFSYTDQYTIRVVYDAILSIYTMFKDAHGFPSIGLQLQTTTDEPNGVEVSFAVEEADIQSFHEAAQKALQYFTPLPIVSNGTLNPPEYTYIGNGWSMRDKAGELGIIMGGVRYPAAAASMSYDLRTDKRLSPLLSYGLDLTLPIGACTVATSREALSYKAKTSESIKAALEMLIDDVVATFANMFDTQPSRWDAMKALAEETGIDSAYRSSRAQLLLGNALYQGTKLELDFKVGPEEFRLTGHHPYEFKAWRVEPVRGRRSKKCPPPQWVDMQNLFGITPARIETLIIDDLPQTPKSKTVRKLREYIEDLPQVQQTLIVRGPNVASILRLLHNPTEYVLTSSLPEPLSAAKATRGTRPRVRMFRFNGTHDKYTHARLSNLTPSLSKADAVSEVAYVDQPATGIMVVMRSFDLPTGFYRIMESGLMSFSELAFVNESDASKLKDSYKTYDVVFNERLAAALAKSPNMAEQLAVRRDPVIADLRGSFVQMRHMSFTPAQLKRPYGKLLELWRNYDNKLTTEEVKLAPFVTAKLPAGAKPKDWYEAMSEDVKILIEVLDLTVEGHRNLLLKNL